MYRFYTSYRSVDTASKDKLHISGQNHSCVLNYFRLGRLGSAYPDLEGSAVKVGNPHEVFCKNPYFHLIPSRFCGDIHQISVDMN